MLVNEHSKVKEEVKIIGKPVMMGSTNENSLGVFVMEKEQYNFDRGLVGGVRGMKDFKTLGVSKEFECDNS